MSLGRYARRRWLVANPIILYRIMRGFFRALVLRKNTLKTIYLFPTFACQAKCKMCSTVKYRRGDAKMLTLDEYESIAVQGAKMGAVAVTLLGGEPLLAKDLEDIIRTFKRHHYFVSILTNGIAVTPDYAHRLCVAGLDGIHIGIECMDASLEDDIKGTSGHHQQALEAARICQDEGLFVGICTVFLPENKDSYSEVLEYCKEHGLHASLPAVAPVGNAENIEPATEEDRRHLLDLAKKYPFLTIDWAYSYFLKARCPAGKEKIGITCYGDVIGCSLLPVEFGNIRDEPLEQIWRRLGTFSKFKRDNDRCIAAFDRDYIEKILVPARGFAENPVHYKDHPNITPETEPELFSS